MKLSIVIGTRNRLEILQKCLGALLGKVDVEHEIIVIDAGSTDGTLAYLAGLSGIRLVLDDKKLGQARSYNRVFKTITAQYTCWLSDDNVVMDGVLDLAVRILEENPEIGMLALKTKDVLGPFKDDPYIGGISSLGILNCNQGVIRTKVLRDVEYFNEEFMDYGIDSDLTARVLLKGWKVAYTRQVAIHHYREWMTTPDSDDYQRRMGRLERSLHLYESKYKALWEKHNLRSKLKRTICHITCFFVGLPFMMASIMRQARRFRHSGSKKPGVCSMLKHAIAPCIVVLEGLFLGKLVDKLIKTLRDQPEPDKGHCKATHGYCFRDWQNVLCGRYISIWDLYINRDRPFYLVQSLR